MTSLAEPTRVVPSIATPDQFVGRKYLQLVLVLGALSAIGPLTIDMYLPALPELTAEMGATASQTQLTITGLLVGLGLGQLVIGPISDSVGRRKPLLIGLAAHGLMSVLCALAPSITMLAVTRTLQGLAGAAVAVVAMAIVRDLFSGIRAAQLLSRLILVLGVAPILAPSLGSALLTVTSWRGIFVALALAAVGLWVLALVALPETLPMDRRSVGTVSGSLRSYARLLSDRMFVAMVLVAGLMFATLFTYISGAPFILQGMFGLSPQQFGLAFSVNAVGMILMTQLNPIFVKRYGPVRVLSVAVLIGLGSALVLLATTLTGFGGLPGFMVPMAFVMASAGLSFPNAPAIALNRYAKAAGTAAALLGASQFMIGGSIAPLVGALDNGTAVPMAAIMVGTTGLASALFWSARRQLLNTWDM
jgi:DHA1 family bicyclomycin/chloramphenicol resistance-like MFS transporter